jgi:hypothetical protein
MKNIFLAGTALLLVAAAPTFALATDGNVTQSNSSGISQTASSSASTTGIGGESTAISANGALVLQGNTSLGGCGCTGTTSQTNTSSIGQTAGSSATSSGYFGGSATAASINLAGVKQKNFSWR